MRILSLVFILGLASVVAGCGVVYKSPSVRTMTNNGTKVRVVEMNMETVAVANRASYQPRALPAVFRQNAGAGNGMQVNAGSLPEGVLPPDDVLPLETRLPPEVDPGPYRIGVGDVVLLATPQVGSTVEQLSGLLAAQNARQGYTVQDDGAIAIPNIGRVKVANMTLEEAEAELFQRLVENQIDPSFSLEISEFNSRRVSIGGAVATPTVVPVTLTPLYLDEALAAAGGITATDQDYASVRIYRDGTLYQIPLLELYSNRGLERIRLLDGDSLFIDTSYDLELAQAYFQQQISLANFRQSSRAQALAQLNSEIDIRRGLLNEQRDNFASQTEYDAVERDYVYLTGEVGQQSRYTLPYDRQASLADALYQNDGLPTRTANVSQVYVLRGSLDPREFASVTAWNLNLSNATNLILATRFELRPNDIIFVAEQPVTRWNRVINQITPSLINSGVAAATN